MGIGVQALYLLRLMREKGYLSQMSSIMELGSQQFAPDLLAARSAIKTHFPDIDAEKVHLPENLYSLLGLEEYSCIDLDGANNALVYNLNKPIDKEYSYNKVFDFVTNHGTTEHAFDQFECFNNVHKLTKNGGIMLHALPSQGYQNHSFFNYHPSFFMDLASANSYEILGIFYNVDEELFPYYDHCLAERGFAAIDNIAVFAVLRKVHDNPFVVPFDGRYYFDQKGDDFAPRSDVGSHFRVEYNEFPLSNQNLEWGPPNISLSGKVKIVVPVWGRQFTSEFLTFNLRHQIQSKLLKFDKKSNIEYIFVTDNAGVSLIRASEEFSMLQNLVNVRFVMSGHLAHLATYDRLTESYNLALSIAKRDDLYIFTTSDCFFSEEVFEKVAQKLESSRIVLAPALRVLQETFIADVNISGVGFDGRKLLELAMRNEHQLTEAFCINNERRSIHSLPAQVLCRVSNGYVGRWTVMHPLAVRIGNLTAPVKQTIDHTYGVSQIQNWSDVAVLDTIDDGLTVSLTPQSYDQGEEIRFRGSKRKYLANLKEWISIKWATGFHLAQISHPVRLVVSQEEGIVMEQIASGERDIEKIVGKFMEFVNSRRIIKFVSGSELTTQQMLQPALDFYSLRYTFRRLWKKGRRRIGKRLGKIIMGKLRLL